MKKLLGMSREKPSLFCEFKNHSLLLPQTIMRQFLSLLFEKIYPKNKPLPFMTAKSKITPITENVLCVSLPFDGIVLKMTLEDYKDKFIKKAVKQIVRKLKKQEGNLVIFHYMEIPKGLTYASREEHGDIIIHGETEFYFDTRSTYLKIGILYQKLKVCE